MPRLRRRPCPRTAASNSNRRSLNELSADVDGVPSDHDARCYNGLVARSTFGRHAAWVTDSDASGRIGSCECCKVCSTRSPGGMNASLGQKHQSAHERNKDYSQGRCQYSSRARFG